LARGGTHEGKYDGGGRWGIGTRDETIDGLTPLFFREIARPYRTAAIVGQPLFTDIAEARAIAAEIGLVCHVPPNSTASWNCPGWTRFFCFTRPAVARVQFLPEQLERSEEAAG